jgi:asparagine synthase (glutamine-hydrolysing)
LCGIAGFTHLRGFKGSGRLHSAVASLAHRGPDQQGVWESEAISIGATRLKIIDLEAGDQPFISDDGDTIVAFNGEIYNHQELRPELERRGYRFRSQTDTETVLAAFREWDVSCFPRLRGMFAVAIWTESTRRLVLGRDRMGIKPLYFASRGDDIYFGSELKALFVHPEIERSISLTGLDHYLTLNYVPGPWTLVQNINKISPGHWLEWREGKLRSEAYWRLPFAKPMYNDMEVAKGELDRLLRQSVREHLVSDVPLGLWLSSGIDSSTLLHYASQSHTGPLRTFSVSFRGRTFDESNRIRKIAAHYGTIHEEIDLNPKTELIDAIVDVADAFDEPNGDGGALPVWFLSRLTKRTATVALSGEGADELFGGYVTYRADDLARIARHLPRLGVILAKSAAELLPASNEKIGFEYKLQRFLSGSLLPPARAHVYWNGTFDDPAKRNLTKVTLPGRLDGTLHDVSAAGDHLIFVVRPKVLFTRRYPDEGRQSKYGSLYRGAASFPGSPDCGVRSWASLAFQNSRIAAKTCIEEPDAE